VPAAWPKAARCHQRLLHRRRLFGLRLWRGLIGRGRRLMSRKYAYQFVIIEEFQRLGIYG
jgi:hypothetical protein